MARFPALGVPRLHPLHALLLGFPIALFAFALVADLAYLSTAEMQWSNLAAWAITAALLTGAPVLAWAALAWLRVRTGWAYPVLLAAMWLLGLVNAFHHSGDGWASVGAGGLILSILTTGLALAAGWIAFSSARSPIIQGAAR